MKHHTIGIMFSKKKLHSSDTDELFDYRSTIDEFSEIRDLYLSGIIN